MGGFPGRGVRVGVRRCGVGFDWGAGCVRAPPPYPAQPVRPIRPPSPGQPAVARAVRPVRASPGRGRPTGRRRGSDEWMVRLGAHHGSRALGVCASRRSGRRAPREGPAALRPCALCCRPVRGPCSGVRSRPVGVSAERRGSRTLFTGDGANAARAPPGQGLGSGSRGGRTRAVRCVSRAPEDRPCVILAGRQRTRPWPVPAVPASAPGPLPYEVGCLPTGSVRTVRRDSASVVDSSHAPPRHAEPPSTWRQQCPEHLPEEAPS